MAHPYHHALSSVKKWGGTVDDYLAVHSWFDQSKEITADFRHRALRHHAEGIFMAETIFGPTLTLSITTASSRLTSWRPSRCLTIPCHRPTMLRRPRTRRRSTSRSRPGRGRRP